MTTDPTPSRPSIAHAAATYHNQIIGLCALAVLAWGFVYAPEARLDKLGHALETFAATTGGQMVIGALVALIVAVLRWALARVPGGGAVLLVACAIAASTSSCGAGAQEAALRTIVRDCEAAEDAILAREGTDDEQDRDDLDAVHTRCVREIEAVH